LVGGEVIHLRKVPNACVACKCQAHWLGWCP
jgi:hypothetical protein